MLLILAERQSSNSEEAKTLDQRSPYFVCFGSPAIFLDL
jgi:hypothetical protein